MQESLITFETAKLAKKKGFDEKCSDCFNEHDMLFSCGWCEEIIDNDIIIPFDYADLKQLKYTYILRPTQSLLQKWLREVHNIDVLPSKPNGNHSKDYISKIYINGTRLKWVGHSENYENVFEIGLQEGLKLIKS